MIDGFDLLIQHMGVHLCGGDVAVAHQLLHGTDVRSVFHIRGKRYICEKITATFTEKNGMSQLLKGVFYPMQET